MGKKERQELFLKHFRESHGIVSYACQKVGITRACYYKWRDSDLKFKERAEEVEEETIDVVESKLLSAINNDDLTAIIFYLKTKGKKRGYVERRAGCQCQSIRKFDKRIAGQNRRIMNLSDKAALYMQAWRDDWCKFCSDVLKARLDKEQQDIIHSVQCRY